jgi:hypothetical protein
VKFESLGLNTGLCKQHPVLFKLVAEHPSSVISVQSLDNRTSVLLLLSGDVPGFVESSVFSTGMTDLHTQIFKETCTNSVSKQTY